MPCRAGLPVDAADVGMGLAAPCQRQLIFCLVGCCADPVLSVNLTFCSILVFFAFFFIMLKVCDSSFSSLKDLLTLYRYMNEFVETFHNFIKLILFILKGLFYKKSHDKIFLNS